MSILRAPPGTDTGSLLDDYCRRRGEDPAQVRRQLTQRRRDDRDRHRAAALAAERRPTPIVVHLNIAGIDDMIRQRLDAMLPEAIDAYMGGAGHAQ